MYVSFSPLPLVCLLCSAIGKASSGNHFASLFLGDDFDHCLQYNVMNLHPVLQALGLSSLKDHNP